MTSPDPSPYVPPSIGLCLSGGGFRAAAFHLGTLSYLQRIGWLSRVSVLSTVSGGTLTGARYAVALLDHDYSYEKFFREYRTQLKETQLFRLALGNLAEPQNSSRSSRRKIITAMTDAYAATLYQNPATKLPYLFGHLLRGDTRHLREIIFNSTEFRTGLAFRFQKTATGRIGNKYYRLPEEVAEAFRLADVVAASSCFPGGFEPLEFPQDFVLDDERRQLVSSILSAAGEGGSESIPLMDGGIVDNQGMESLLLADSRLREDDGDDEGEPSDEVAVYFISDTDRQSPDLFPYPPPIKLWIDPTLALLRNLVWVGYVLCSLSAVVLLGDWLQADGESIGWRLLRTILPLLLVGGTAFLLWWLPHLIRTKILSLVPDLKSESWRQLKTLKLSEFLDMVMLRGVSLMALAELIFMKRIRSLGYHIIYNDLRRRESIISNYIYHLQKGRPFLDRGLLAELAAIPGLPLVTKPEEKLTGIATKAASVATKLWFDGNELDELIDAGYATTCYNVLKFLLRRIKKEREEGRDPAPYIAALRPVFDDWQKLAEEPAAGCVKASPTSDNTPG